MAGAYADCILSIKGCFWAALPPKNTLYYFPPFLGRGDLRGDGNESSADTVELKESGGLVVIDNSELDLCDF